MYSNTNENQQKSAEGNQIQQKETMGNLSEVSGYLSRLTLAKKWWSKKNSSEYNVILDLLRMLQRAEEDSSKSEAKEAMIVDIYTNLYIKCIEYLESHKSYRWTSVGRERFRIISEIKNRIQDKVQDKVRDKIVPILTTNGTQEELQKIEARNKQWRDSNQPIYSDGGLTTIIKQNTDGNESAYKEWEDIVNDGMTSINVHLGKNFAVDGLGISRIMANNPSKGFHDDNVDEQTNYNNMIQMRDDLLAGHEDWRKGDDTPEKQENIDRNIRGLKAYRSIILRQQKHLYNKYGKFLPQLHPYDILLRTNDLKNDAQIDQDISQIFGIHDTDKTFDELKNNFKKRKESNEYLQQIFTPETEKEDLFIITSYWYYARMLFNLNNICNTLPAVSMGSKPDLSEKGFYVQSMITKIDIEKEKEVEKAAQAIGLGKMKGFTPFQKKVYLQTLRKKGMDEDFKIKENLTYQAGQKE